MNESTISIAGVEISAAITVFEIKSSDRRAGRVALRKSVLLSSFSISSSLYLISLGTRCLKEQSQSISS